MKRYELATVDYSSSHNTLQLACSNWKVLEELIAKAQK